MIDTWLEEIVIPLMKGKVKAFHYADDLVICCRYEEDTNRIKKVLGKCLTKFKLKLNEEKTKMVYCGSFMVVFEIEYFIGFRSCPYPILKTLISASDSLKNHKIDVVSVIINVKLLI